MRQEKERPIYPKQQLRMKLNILWCKRVKKCGEESAEPKPGKQKMTQILSLEVNSVTPHTKKSLEK